MPHVSSLLQFYPGEPAGPFVEVWQGMKVRNLHPDFLTPMYRLGPNDFYVQELVQMQDGRYILPVKWIIRAGKMCADAWLVEKTQVRYSGISK
jgi:hypothetical protein